MNLDYNDYQEEEIRALPTILLIDTSGSMGMDLGGAKKIDKLNEAVKKMMNKFDELEQFERFIRVTVIAFDNNVRLIGQVHSEPAKLLQNFMELTSQGMTYLGLALDEAKSILEDPTKTPKRWYKPVVILVSDGEPNGNWEAPLDNFIGEGKSAKSQRFAVAIGAEAARAKNTLIKFTGTEKNLLFAQNADDIVKHFEFLSRTVYNRASQKNPDLFSIDSTSAFDTLDKPKLFAGTRKTSTSQRKTRSIQISQNNQEDDDDDWG